MGKPYQKNAADREQGRHAERKEKFNRTGELEDLKEVLSSKPGRRFIWGLLEKTGIFRSSFTGNSQTFFYEGERNVGLSVYADIMDASPESYLTMQREAKEREHNA